MRLRVFVFASALAFALHGCAASVPISPRAPAAASAGTRGAAEPGGRAAAAPASEPGSPLGAAPVQSPDPAPQQAGPTPEPRPAAAVEPVMTMALTPAKPLALPSPERYVSLNFDNADISVVIQTIAELLRMNYIVAPTVRGRISIQTSEKLPVSSLLPVLEQILEVNGFMAVKSGEFYKIVPSNQAKQEAIETVSPETAPAAGTGLVTKIVRLRFISPGEVVKILTPFKTAAGLYQGHESARLLFLTEVPAKIAELLKIVEVLDVDTFASIQVELYPVRYAGVEDLARELSQIVTQVFASAGRGRTLFRIIPVPQVNAIMVFSGEPGLTASIREWIAKLDQPASEANERIFVYPLSHATAETLAGVIEKVFRREPTKAAARSTPAAAAQPASAAPGQPAAARATQAAVAPAQAVASTGQGGAASAAAPVVVVADKDTNTLIIQTVSWFYPTVEEMIRKLDAMPKQVLIEVLIAEITLDDSNQFGISWDLKGQGPVTAFGETHQLTSQTTQNLGSLAQSQGGLSVLVTEASRLTAVLNAYAQDSKLNILSAPHILATNNKEAKIDVGNEVPIIKTQANSLVDNVNTSQNANNNAITTDIEYRSTGVILTVTPHVNEGGYVTLDLQQEVSEVAEKAFGLTNSPSFFKRSAKTSMVVKDEQTLVIGGLIQETRNNARSGLPWLNRIPILGYLFGSTNSSVRKTELVLFITPRVVNNVEEGEVLTRQVRERVLTLKQGIEQFRTLKGAGAAP